MSESELLPELHGWLANGYTEDTIDSVCADFAEDLPDGCTLFCLWAYSDDWGAGGDSELLLIDADGAVFELSEDCWSYLQGERTDPGPVESWFGTRRTDVDLDDSPELGSNGNNVCRELR